MDKINLYFHQKHELSLITKVNNVYPVKRFLLSDSHSPGVDGMFTSMFLVLYSESDKI